MKAVIVSIICRCLAFLAILAFVFGIVYMTKNTRYLWLLCLLATVYCVPTYECKGVTNTDNSSENRPETYENPFDI